jgi:hypothetical protein
VLRHVLRNNASPVHAFELVCALKRRTEDQVFWQTWAEMHDPRLRALQAIAFQFASRWFGCSLSPVAERECRMLPEPIHAWFRSYAFSPLVNLVEPNKDALWLHMALLPRRIDRLAVAVRKLVPLHVPREEERGAYSYATHVLNRSRYHAVALARALFMGSRRRRTAPSTASQTSD